MLGKATNNIFVQIEEKLKMNENNRNHAYEYK